jgi:archaellum component FlaC
VPGEDGYQYDDLGNLIYTSYEGGYEAIYHQVVDKYDVDLSTGRGIAPGDDTGELGYTAVSPYYRNFVQQYGDRLPSDDVNNPSLVQGPSGTSVSSSGTTSNVEVLWEDASGNYVPMNEAGVSWYRETGTEQKPLLTEIYDLVGGDVEPYRSPLAKLESNEYGEAVIKDLYGQGVDYVVRNGQWVPVTSDMGAPQGEVFTFGENQTGVTYNELNGTFERKVSGADYSEGMTWDPGVHKGLNQINRYTYDPKDPSKGWYLSDVQDAGNSYIDDVDRMATEPTFGNSFVDELGVTHVEATGTVNDDNYNQSTFDYLMNQTPPSGIAPTNSESGTGFEQEAPPAYTAPEGDSDVAINLPTTIEIPEGFGTPTVTEFGSSWSTPYDPNSSGNLDVNVGPTQGELDTANNTISNLQNQINSITQDYNDAQADYNNVSNELTQVTNDYNNATQQVQTLEQELNVARQDSSTSQATIDSMVGQIETLKNDVSTYENNQTVLQKQLDDSNSLIGFFW